MTTTNIPAKRFHTQITLPRKPINPKEIATKGYVDDVSNFTVLSAAATLEPARRYFIKTAGDYALPATIAIGETIEIFSEVTGVRIVQGDVTIAGTSPTGALTLDANNYVVLTAGSVDQVTITDYSLVTPNVVPGESLEYVTIVTDPLAVLTAGEAYAIAADGLFELSSVTTGSQTTIYALAESVVIDGSLFPLSDRNEGDDVLIPAGSFAKIVAISPTEVKLFTSNSGGQSGSAPVADPNVSQVINAAGPLSKNRSYVLTAAGNFALPTDCQVGDYLKIYARAGATLTTSGVAVVDVAANDSIAMAVGDFIELLCINTGRLGVARAISIGT